jgi:hypothetical protein
MMPVLCPGCGHLNDARRSDGAVRRHGIVVCLDPPTVFHRQRLLRPNPYPTCVRFLFVLLRWGEASYEMFYPAMASGDATMRTLQAHMTRLRNWLAEQGVDVVIEVIADWGYRIRKDETKRPLGDWSAVKAVFAEMGDI